AKEAIEEKNPTLENKDAVAKSIAVSAIIYNDLKHEKHLNVDFNLQNMLKFEGQTGPYIQYTSVRMAALLRQLPTYNEMLDDSYLNNDPVHQIALLLSQFDDAIERAKEEFQPSMIARYAFTLCQSFNSWYGSQKFVTENMNETQTNLSIVQATRYVLNQSMKLLGLTVLDYM
ncbi:MAG: DALR anticodon-binding domain-containing protein, partial [Acholeplasmataceae bacterium]